MANPNHEPAGSSAGGQFAKGDGNASMNKIIRGKGTIRGAKSMMKAMNYVNEVSAAVQGIGAKGEITMDKAEVKDNYKLLEKSGMMDVTAEPKGSPLSWSVEEKIIFAFNHKIPLVLTAAERSDWDAKVEEYYQSLKYDVDQ